MIFGIGVDISKVQRFQAWIYDKKKLSRFFNEKEFFSSEIENPTEAQLCQHYASRYAAKEAFSKALGTGLRNFNLTDLYIKKDELGKPKLILENKALEIFQEKCGNSTIHVSLSHEEDYSIAYVVIEKNSN